MTDNIAPLIAANLSKSYAERTVVAEASLSLQPGEITALVGGSGAGKSTLLRLLAGMERPDSGTVHSGDTMLSGPSQHMPPELRRIGLIFQDFALFPHLDVTRNIMFGLGHLPKQQRENVAARWLSALNLGHRSQAYPHHLSGGEQQRVAIARALAPEPVAILMDEPFSGLDPELREHAREVTLSAIRNAHTPALMVTHDASEALGHADQIAIMREGRILQTGSAEQVYTQPTNLAVTKALGPVQEVQKSQLPTAWHAQLADAETLYLRPEAIRLDPSSQISLKVANARRTGALTIITFVEGDGALTAAMILATTPQPGETLPVSIDQSSVFTFLA